MAFTPIDEQTWERREYLEVFRQTAIYLTAEVDITPLYRHTKARGEKLYPALVWCVAAVLNRHAHFRYGRDEAGRIGIWDELHPYYTVPRRDAPDLFAMKVTRFTPDYDAFLSRFREDYARAETCGRLLCDETLPPNVCGISAMPGLAFSAFSELKHVFLVDEDVDPFDLSDVMWAMTTRFQADVDLIPIPGVRCHPLDPSNHPACSPSIRDGGIACKAIFDCTVPFDQKERFHRCRFKEVDPTRWVPGLRL